jgi:hypothetical protein
MASRTGATMAACHPSKSRHSRHDGHALVIRRNRAFLRALASVQLRQLFRYRAFKAIHRLRAWLSDVNKVVKLPAHRALPGSILPMPDHRSAGGWGDGDENERKESSHGVRRLHYGTPRNFSGSERSTLRNATNLFNGRTALAPFCTCKRAWPAELRRA